MGNDEKIRIALVLRNALFRSSLSELIQQQKGMVIVYEGDGTNLERNENPMSPPHVVVVESQRLEQIRANPFSSCPVLVLSIQDDLHDLRLAVRHGARGYLPQVDAGAEVIAAIRSVARGGIYLGKALTTNMPTCLLPEITQELFACNRQETLECEMD